MKALRLNSVWSPREDYNLTEFEASTKKTFNSSKVWKDPKISLQEVKKPRIESNEVLIRVRSVGICGSDIGFATTNAGNYMNFSGYGRFESIILGHEFSGIVAEKENEVKDFDIGDYVVGEESINCGTCINCRKGFSSFCIKLEQIGVTIDGAMA